METDHKQIKKGVFLQILRYILEPGFRRMEMPTLPHFIFRKADP